MSLSWEQAFSCAGALQEVLPGFEARPQQVAMARAVERGLREKGTVIVEAGTGVGKSMAYLLPSAYWAMEADPEAPRHRRVVVATYTKALQQQLVDKDLPLVARLLAGQGQKLRYSLLMGSENYLCLTRLHRTIEGAGDLFVQGSSAQTLASVASWSERAHTGLRSALPMEVSDELWESVNRNPDLCLGKGCSLRPECPFRKDVERARRTHILVANQHLLLSGLPEWIDFDAVVVDEAHNLEDVAVATLGFELSDQKLARLLAETFNVKTGRGLLARLRGLPEGSGRRIRRAVIEVHEAGRAFFASLREKLRLVSTFELESGSGTRRVVEPGIVEDTLSGCLEELRGLLQAALKSCASLEEEQHLQALHGRYTAAVSEVRRFLECADADFAYWAELRRSRRLAVTSISVKPIDVSRRLGESLFSGNRPVILTSATLSVESKFDLVRQRLGIGPCSEHVLDSPFDYAANARLLLPRHFPDPSQDEDGYREALLEFSRGLIDVVPGGIFFLFTSWKSLRALAQAIPRHAEGRPVFVQGTRSPSALLQDFRQSGNGLLLGTDTFWQGVDVSGSALSCVVLTRLPFMPPDTPLEEARHEWYARRGLRPFTHYTLPKAVIKFRQGFGRLIRTQKDYGAIVVLDPRLRTKPYGRVFLRSIPPAPEVEDLQELKTFFASR